MFKAKILVTDIVFPNRFSVWRNVEIWSLIHEFEADILIPRRVNQFAGVDLSIDLEQLKELVHKYNYNIIPLNNSYAFLGEINKKSFQADELNCPLWEKGDYILSKSACPSLEDYDVVYHIFLNCYKSFNSKMTFPSERQVIHLYPGGGFGSVESLSGLPLDVRIVSTNPLSSKLCEHAGLKVALQCFGGTFYTPSLAKAMFDSVSKKEKTPFGIVFSSLGKAQEKGDGKYLELAKRFQANIGSGTVRFYYITQFCDAGVLKRSGAVHITPMPWKELLRFYARHVHLYLNFDAGAAFNGWPLGVEALMAGASVMTTDPLNVSPLMRYPQDYVRVVEGNSPNEWMQAVNKVYEEFKHGELRAELIAEWTARQFSYANQQEKIFNLLEETGNPQNSHHSSASRNLGFVASSERARTPLKDREPHSNGKPVISVYVLAYMHKFFIRDCIEGILMQQTDFPVQVLIHDDASTDGTARIIRDYQTRYPHLIKVYYQTENVYRRPDKWELMSEFNSWLTGKYVALCEGDDYWTDPLKLQKQVEFLEANPDYDSVFHDAEVHYDSVNSRPHLFTEFPWCITRYEQLDYSIDDIVESAIFPTCSFLHRNPGSFKVWKYAASIPFGDRPLGINVNREGSRIRFIPEVMAVYRRHQGGATQTFRGPVWNSMMLRFLAGAALNRKEINVDRMFSRFLKELSKMDSSNALIDDKILLKIFDDYEQLGYKNSFSEFTKNFSNKKLHRLLFIVRGPNKIDAPNMWLLRFLPLLRSNGYLPHVVVIGNALEDCRICFELIRDNFPVTSIPESFTEDILRKLFRLFQEKEFDALIPNLNVASYFFSKYTKAAGIPTVGVLHSYDAFHRDLEEEFLINQRGEYLSSCVVVSKQQYERLRAEDLGSTELVLAPYGAPVPDDVAQYANEPFRFLYAGRLRDQQKRVTDMLVGMIGVLRKHLTAQFHICGDGEARVGMERLAAESGVGNRIKFYGNLSPEALQALSLKCQAFVLLSDYEGIPIALMEAMACGLVPICANIRSGIPELITNGVEGFIVNDRGPALLKAASQLMKDPQLWQRMSTAARQKIQAGYSVERNAEIWADLLHRLIKENPTPKRPIGIPDEIVLPPVRKNPLGMAREDIRRPTAQSVFVAPRMEPNNADLYLQRQSILTALRGAAPLFSGSFLDVGCGIMPYKQLLTGSSSRISKYIGLDIETETYKADVDLRWDGKAIPLEDNSIDSAVATEVLEHCPEPLVVLKEIRRVLKPGGLFFFTVPYTWPLHDAPYDYWRYTPFSLKKLLGEAGFTDADVRALSGWDASLAQMMGLWLKRAPMNAERRNEMAHKLWPLYQELVATDRLPADPEAGNTMATGWSGLAFAGKAGGRESGHPEVEAAELPLVIARSHEKNYSETFIQDHVDTISARCLDLSGWPFPRYVNGRSILDETDEAALIDAIQHQKPVSESTSRAYVAGVAKWLQQSGAQVALLESGLMGAFLYPACEKAGIPYVVHFHGVDAWKADLLQTWKAKYDRFFRGAAGVIGVSREMVEQLRKLGAPKERLVHAPYGVSVAVERLAEPQTAPPVFVAVGRFVEKKAPQKTLQAFAAMRGKVSEARLVMVGDGPLLSDCRKWVAQQGLEDAVAFTGVLSRRAVSRLLSTARAFVQHSVAAEDGDREGLPLAILEAGAHGLPVVATRHAGIPDAVREEQDGLLVDEGDIKGMAVAMWKLAAQPELAGKMGSSFRERVTAHYSRKVSIERLQRILRCAAERRPVKEALSSEEKPAETTKPAPAAGSAIAAKLAEGQEALKNGETAAAVTAFEAAIARDRNCGEALVQLGSLAAGQGDYETAYLYLKEAQRVGGLPEGAEPTLRALEGNPALQTDTVRVYQESVGMGGFGKTGQPRRILVFTNLLPPQEMGGFGRTVWEFCDGLMQRGHEVKILTADVKHLEQEPYPGYERVEKHVERSLQLFGDWKNGVAQDETDMEVIKAKALHNVRTILAAVKRFKPDICMAGNLDFLSGAMLDPILEQGIPIVHRLGNANPGYAADGTPKSPLYCIASCSSWVNEDLARNGYAPANFAVLPAGAPLHEYYRLVPPKFDYLRICYAGLVMGYKGPHLLVEALGMLKKLGIRFSCEIAGDIKNPDYGRAFKALIQKHGLGDRVRLLGFQNRKGLAAMFARNNTLVFPSVFQEPFGKVQIEAQAAGLAVVRSAVGGYADMLQDEENGLLFRGEDAEDLARQLYVLQGDRELWAKIAARGQVDAFRFTTRNCVELLEEIMEALLEKRG